MHLAGVQLLDELPCNIGKPDMVALRSGSDKMMKPIRLVSILLALLIGVFALPTNVMAKCPDVPDDLVCAELRYSFQPTSPIAGEQVKVTAHWADERTAGPVTNAQWLARRGKPAYLWIWDHEPSELESIAYVEGMEGKAELPQILVPLLWDAEKQEYQGTFMLPKSGRWYFRLGTLVPDAMRPTMEADSDYGGPIQPIDIPATTRSLFGTMNWLIGSALILGSGLTITRILLWPGRFLQRLNQSRANRRLYTRSSSAVIAPGSRSPACSLEPRAAGRWSGRRGRMNCASW